ncbi:peptidase [Streptomyces violarus]|uniref:Murein DD-endopeptidase MepM/ murein hydrolase activator NlpD n=1 Tax=Streptomyces violarus TaxID=67380 RepID=A0A7W5EZN3_9ACTN|nr:MULTISPECIES: LysM peptidoglycan-binding domain-containing M23 family metallopeptidase [Streptomyces]MBB3074524.1 murein DD-endopeptidase MepM/ murein hydrolase activator NlpD [Streptomyces violarus]WRT97208.1 LysM peptidoglycan-binding domain-containing M23 family metallopeptidase [Streptomyces sp. CGMCC 4.1772]GHC99606.1 peptidase [Streptomyces violarus]
MPAKGKHRRPKTQRFTRSIAVAGTGGAALALPLMGAAGAHAATPQSAPEKAVQSAPAAEKKAAEKATGARAYTVKAGDYLAKIADDQNVSGGWKKLYADNRDAVGADPSLIHPGLKLSVGKKAAGEPKAQSSAPKASAEKSSAAESSSKADTAAKPAAAKPAAEASGFSLPVDGAAVGTPYHMSGSMWSSGYHTGVDFVVPTGTSLKAVGAGTVVSAGWGGAYGNQVVIQLEDGKYAQYAHLSSLSVSAGQTVTAGQQIGLSGATGNVTGPHLHFEIRTTPDYGSDVDPVAYLRSHGVSVG